MSQAPSKELTATSDKVPSELFANLAVPSFEKLKLLLLNGANPLETNTDGVTFLKAAESVLKPEEFNALLMSSIPRPVYQEMSNLIGEDGLVRLETSQLLSQRNLQSFLGLEAENPSSAKEAAKYFLQILFLLSPKNKSKEFYDHVIEKNAKTNFLLTEDVVSVAIRQGDVSTLRQILASGFDLNSMLTSKPLFTALFGGSLEIIQLLLIYGASPIQIDQKGTTFLRAAHVELTEDEFNKVLFCSIPRPVYQELSSLIGQDGLDLLETSKLLSLRIMESTLKLEVESPLPPLESAGDFLTNLYNLSKRGAYDEFRNHLIRKNAENKFLDVVDELAESKVVKPLDLLSLAPKVNYERDCVQPAEVVFRFAFNGDEYKLDDVKEWFASKGIQGVVVYQNQKTDRKEIEIWLNSSHIKCESAKIIDVITVLAEHKLGLTEKSNKEIHVAFLEAKEEIAKKELTEQDQDQRARVLIPYLRGKEELEGYFKMFPKGLGPRERNLYRYFELFLGLDAYFDQLNARLFNALSSGEDEQVQQLLKDGANPLQKNPKDDTQSFLVAAESIYWPMQPDMLYDIYLCSIPRPIYQELSNMIGEEGLAQLKDSDVLSASLIEKFLNRIHAKPDSAQDSAKYFLNRLFTVSAEYPCDKFCDFLIKKNADKKFLDTENPSVLDYAISRKKIEFVQQLLSFGFDPTGNKSADYPEKRHLFTALASGSTDIINLLLLNGADPLQTDQYFRTFLHVASLELSKEASVLNEMYINAIPRSIYSELSLIFGLDAMDQLKASELLDASLMEALLKRVRDNSETPLDSAKYFLNRVFGRLDGDKFDKLRVLLLEINKLTPFLDQPETKAPTEEKSERMKEILQVLGEEKLRQFDAYLDACMMYLNKQNKLQDWLSGANNFDRVSLDVLFGISMHLAIIYNHDQLVDFLLLNKLLTNQVSVGLLISALERTEKNYLRSLLNYGLDPNADVRQCQIHDKPNNTYLFWAYRFKTIDGMEMLLKAGANTDTVHFVTGKTVLEMAEEDGRADVVELITRVNKERGIVTVKKVEIKEKPKSATASEKSSETEEDKESEDANNEKAYVSNAFDMIFANLAKDEDREDFVAYQWTASGKCKVRDEDFSKIQEFLGSKIDPIYLKDVSFNKFSSRENDTHDHKVRTHNIRARFQNVLIYAGKLYREHEDCDNPKKKAVLASKIDAVSQFVNMLMPMENFNEDDKDSQDLLLKAFNTFEQHDANRGTGLYRVYSFFKNKRFEDEKGKSRLVLSTMGELVYDFYQAVKPPEVKVEKVKERVEGQEDDDSVSSISLGV